MSDVTVAADSGGASAPASNQVAINTNPVDSPNPVGSQAPQAPVGDIEGSPHRPESRREAIQKAFERATNPPPKTDRPAQKPAPKAAEAKPGHNNPPAESKTPQQKEMFDLKKRPSEQAAKIEDRPRGDHGHFKSRQQQPAGQQGQPTQQGQPQGQQAGISNRQAARALPDNAPYRQPMKGMSQRAMQEWSTTPESVRGDMHRMHREFKQASDYYKADHAEMNDIRSFQKMAQEHGTTLKQALTNYTSMEQKLRSDPIAGLDTIVNNLNLKTPDGQQLGLRDIAYYILSQTPDQLRAVQQGNMQTAAAQQIGALHQQIASLQNTVQQMHNQQRFTYTRSAVDQFADTHPRFDELGDLIENELKLGFDLETAYRRANMLRPATHAAETRTTPAKTRPPADKSIYGAPDNSAPGVSKRPREASRSPRDAVQNALRRVNGL